jgi:hypothetical protein
MWQHTDVSEGHAASIPLYLRNTLWTGSGSSDVIFGNNMEVTGQLHAPATFQVKQPPGT